MLHRLLEFLSVFRAGFIILILLIASIATNSTGGFLVAATSLPDLGTLHILSRALDLDPGPSEPVTLVVINDTDHDKIGAPMPMQKRYLAKLVEELRPMGPKAIVVDFDISLPTAPDDMETLEALLAGWKSDDPLLMFPREFTPVGSEEVTAVSTTFDSYFSGNRPLFWISTVFQNSENEHLDEWSLWTTPQNSCEALFSPQLLLHLYPKHSGPEQVRKASACLASMDRHGICQAVSGCNAASGIDFAALDSRRNTSVHFVLGDDLKRGPSQDFVNVAGRSEPAFYVWSSSDLIDKSIAATSIRDRVVVIGGGYVKANDRHDTPIGRMDGARILSNAISTADRTLQADKFPPLLASSLIVVLSVIALVGFLMLKPIFFGLLYFAAILAVYAGMVHIADVGTAGVIVRGTIGLTAISIALESIISFARDLVCKRLGWRSVLNDPK